MFTQPAPVPLEELRERLRAQIKLRREDRKDWRRVDAARQAVIERFGKNAPYWLMDHVCGMARSLPPLPRPVRSAKAGSSDLPLCASFVFAPCISLDVAELLGIDVPFGSTTHVAIALHWEGHIIGLGLADVHFKAGFDSECYAEVLTTLAADAADRAREDAQMKFGEAVKADLNLA